MAALRDDSIVNLIKVDTKDNLADLNSKLLDEHNFERLHDQIMTRRPIPEVKGAAAPG